MSSQQKPNVLTFSEMLQQTATPAQPAPSQQPPLSPQQSPSQELPPSHQQPLANEPAPSSTTPSPLVEQSPKPQPAASYEPAPSQEQGGQYYRRGNYVEDSLAQTLDAYSQAVLSQLLRLSWGNQRDWCHVGLPKLTERTGFSIDRVRKSKKILLARGIIEIVDEDNDNPAQELRGTTYKIKIPAPPLPQQGGSQQRAPRREPAKKDKALKDSKEKGESRCDKCRETAGFIYMDGNSVVRCKHE